MRFLLVVVIELLMLASAQGAEFTVVNKCPDKVQAKSASKFTVENKCPVAQEVKPKATPFVASSTTTRTTSVTDVERSSIMSQGSTGTVRTITLVPGAGMFGDTNCTGST